MPTTYEEQMRKFKDYQETCQPLHEIINGQFLNLTQVTKERDELRKTNDCHLGLLKESRKQRAELQEENLLLREALESSMKYLQERTSPDQFVDWYDILENYNRVLSATPKTGKLQAVLEAAIEWDRCNVGELEYDDEKDLENAVRAYKEEQS